MKATANKKKAAQATAAKARWDSFINRDKKDKQDGDSGSVASSHEADVNEEEDDERKMGASNLGDGGKATSNPDSNIDKDEDNLSGLLGPGDDSEDEREADSEDEGEDHLENQAPLQVVNHPPIVAELDEEEDDDVDCYFDDELDDEDVDNHNDDVEPEGVMHTYIEAIYRRLQYETTGKIKGLEVKWLLNFLRVKAHGFWIRKEHAEFFCGKLGIEFEHSTYYRDVKVWLPDEQWGRIAMPCCLGCKKNSRVGVKGYRTNHFARRVVTLYSSYYVMSRRYICHGCKEERAALEERVVRTAALNSVEVEITQDMPQYTFMGYNPVSVGLLPFGYGDNFPAFLTHRSAVDKSIIDWMRPLYDSGVRPEAFSDILLELHSKEYLRNWKAYEHEVERYFLLNSGRDDETVMYSLFSDKTKYDGRVPTGKYLSRVYKLYHRSIKQHLAKEVKKRGARWLHWDASYKEAKHLCRYRGSNVFKALITATNEYGEVRLQFHVVTDGHDQMRAAVAAFNKTNWEYGQPMPELFFTDNPSADKEFFVSVIPSLRISEERLNAATQVNESQMAHCYMPRRFIRVAQRNADMNQCTNALRERMRLLPENKRVLGLDCEWEVSKNARGMIVKSHKLALIQLSYEDESKNLRAILLRVHQQKTLPDQLRALFEDHSVKFTGVGVGGDLKKIGRDLECRDLVDQIPAKNVINLGSFARVRDVVQDGTIGLASLTEIVLKQHLAKPSDVRCSKWSASTLTNKQKIYAALDAVKSLELYLYLLDRPDLSVRLKPEEANPNKEIDIVPSRGNVANMATRAGWGKISESRWCDSPHGITPARAIAPTGSVVVRVERVTASHLIVPRMKNSKDERATLGDFGEPPFRVVLPISMLREHVESDDIRVTTPEELPRENDEGGQSPPASTANSDCPSASQGSHDEVNHEYIDGAADEEMAGLTTEDIEFLRAIDQESEAALNGQTPLQCPHLDPPPDPGAVKNVYSSVLGDGFHGINRSKVPIKAEIKKAFKVAFQEAFFSWNPLKLQEYKEALSADGYTEVEIESEMYFNVKAVRACVDRRILPPKQLYWRVRAVFVIFGSKIDSRTKKPLFNTEAWKKANNLLKEILQGYYSDPPGVSFYTLRLNRKGDVMKNRYGFELIECNRGTNRTENFHKQILTTFGTWHTGIEMSDCLTAERRHRFNHRVSERRRLGFPQLGHFDTWLVDSLQILVMRNHGALLYSDWTNASDYKDTDESFGTVALHSQELADAVEAAWKRIKEHEDLIDKENEGKAEEDRVQITKVKLTQDQKYLCTGMGTDLPFLPFFGGEHESKLFARKVLEAPMDDEEMAIEWTQHVDGINIFPKLPVHIRTQREQFDRNQRIRDAVRRAMPGIQKLNELNVALRHNLDSSIEHHSGGDGENENDDSPGPSPGDDSSTAANETQAGEETSTLRVVPHARIANAHWPVPLMPTPLAAPHPQARHNLHAVIIGGTRIGLALREELRVHKRKRGERGRDAMPRKKRPCARCKQFMGLHFETCKGRGGTRYCEYFEENGSPKTTS